MKPSRVLAWLLTIVALMMPPAMGQSASSMAGAPIDQVAAPCADHAPPPTPCPEHDTAKHAAGTCCSLMAAAVALLPDMLTADRTDVTATLRPAAMFGSLTGFLHAMEPPPPRL